MRRSLFVFPVTLVVLLASCGASDDANSSATTSPSTTASTTSTTAPRSTSTAAATPTTAVGGEPACASYTKIVGLYDSIEPIATGAVEGQDDAQATWDAAIESLRTTDGEADATLAASLATLARLDFHVTEDATGAPTEQELVDALATLDGNYRETCYGGDGPGECPAPETLEAEGYTCDSEGNLSPVAEAAECPAPETLEAEGYTCDAEGNLTPVGEASDPGVVDCLPPVVVEQDPMTCDSQGNLEPSQ